jgi:hypothetical protein
LIPVESTIFRHRVTFERRVNGRIHRFSYSKDCRLHADIYEAVFERALRRGVIVDINSLIDSVVATSCDGHTSREVESQDEKES